MSPLKPHAGSNTEKEETCYRRGFDQGVANFAYVLGINNDDLQRLGWKKRIADFRYGRTQGYPPHIPTDAELKELRAVALAALQSLGAGA